jgi:hypothetical protein
MPIGSSASAARPSAVSVSRGIGGGLSGTPGKTIDHAFDLAVL